MDHIIPRETALIDGAASHRNVQPGDRLLVPAGERGPLRFCHLRGAPGAPITIVNRGGQVKIGADHWCLIELEDCQHIRLTGTGQPGLEHGFTLSGFTNCGVFARKGSEYIELDHLEIHHSTGSNKGTGIRASSTEEDMGEGWIQHETHIHHCSIHDISGEATYVGKYDAQGGTPLHGVEIAYNRAERCATDAVQIRNAREGCHVHHNYAEDIGADVGGSMQGGAGLIARPRTGGRWHDNVVVNADRGIQLLEHQAGIEIYQNLLVHCGYVRQQGGMRVFTTEPFVAHHNTIVQSAQEGIRVTGEGRGEVYDNLIVASGGDQLRAGDAVTRDHNILLDTLRAARFADLAAGDYRPGPGSPALGAARDGGTVGAYPETEEAPPTPPEPPTPPSLPETITVTVEIGGVIYQGEIRARVG